MPLSTPYQIVTSPELLQRVTVRALRPGFDVPFEGGSVDAYFLPLAPAPLSVSSAENFAEFRWATLNCEATIRGAGLQGSADVGGIALLLDGVVFAAGPFDPPFNMADGSRDLFVPFVMAVWGPATYDPSV